jgi:hypothetical protein
MDTKKVWFVGAATALLVIAGGVLWLRASEPPERPSPVAALAPAPAVPPAPAPLPNSKRPDVAGLPPLFPEGVEYPKSDLSIDEYFANFGGAKVLDPATKKIRDDVAAKLRDELVGKQVTWDGYVQRIENAPSGRVTLVLALKPGQTGLDAAMIRFAAGWGEQIHAYQKGDRVRVVAVYDKIVSVFPSLRGLSVESIPAEGSG